MGIFRANMVAWTRAKGGSRKKWTDLKSVSKVVLIDLADGLDVREEGKTRLKIIPRVY